MAKKIVLTLVVVFLVFYIVSQPSAAADGAQTDHGRDRMGFHRDHHVLPKPGLTRPR